MQASFPPRILLIQGKPHLTGLILILNHTIDCAQTNHTDGVPLEKLHIAMGPVMWAPYSQAIYLIQQPPIRDRLVYPAGASSGVRATIDNGFALIYKKYHEEAKMDKCLIERTYKLLEPTYTADLKK